MSFELLVVVVDIIMPAMRRAVIMQNRHRQSQREKERESEWESMSKWERAVWVSLRPCMRLRDARLYVCVFVRVCVRICVSVWVALMSEWIYKQFVINKVQYAWLPHDHVPVCVRVCVPVFVNSRLYVCLPVCVRECVPAKACNLNCKLTDVAPPSRLHMCVCVCVHVVHTNTVTELRRRSNGTIKFKWNQEKKTLNENFSFPF